MQVFGKIKTVHDLEYIVKTYVYIPLEDEEISVEDLDLLLKIPTLRILILLLLVKKLIY